jgi:hypothetical protein
LGISAPAHSGGTVIRSERGQSCLRGLRPDAPMAKKIVRIQLTGPRNGMIMATNL